MKTAGVALTMALGLLLPLGASAQEALFAERPTALDRDVGSQLGVVRARGVSIDLRALPGADGASALPGTGHALRLNLFDDVVLVARMTRVERLEKGLSWSGRLVDDPFGSVEIVVYDGVVTGSVNGRAGSYRIGWDGAGQVVQEMDYSQFPEEDDCGRDRPDAALDETDLEPRAASDSGAIVDVLVVYTPAAKAAEGGTNAMNALINLAISETNTSYANSGVVQRVRLVHTAEVSLTETSISTDLNRLTDTDGVIDDVHTLRNTYKADLVSLFGQGYTSSDGACGVAWLYPSVAANAFSVVDRSCATGYYSFGHEMGHNMGLNHAHGDPTGTGAYNYSYGHKWLVPRPQLPPLAYRSVMAYSPGTRVPYFSNPGVFHSGQPTGVSDYADNARSLNNTRVAVANWRVGDTPKVTVTSPNGGESHPVGSIQSITWTSSALDPLAEIRLDYTNGSTTTTIATGLSRTSTSYNWTIPNAIGSSWKVEVCSWVGGSCEAQDLSNASFSIVPAAAGPPEPHDFSGDGKADILWHHQGVGDLYTWILDGTVTTGGSYLDPSRYADTRWQIRGISDFNRDGRNDILWHHQGTGDLYVWFMNGTVAIGGSYLSPSSFSDTRWQIRGISDFNGDGVSDILWHHQTTGHLYVWFMSGLSVSGGSYLTPARFTDTRWVIRGIGDFDGDGRNDILWHHQGTGELYVWFLNGTVTTGGSYLTPSAFSDTRWKIVQVADFTGDGKIDILWHHQVTGALYVWVLDGTVTTTGTYLTPSSFSDTQWKVVPQ